MKLKLALILTCLLTACATTTPVDQPPSSTSTVTAVIATAPAATPTSAPYIYQESELYQLYNGNGITISSVIVPAVNHSQGQFPTSGNSFHLLACEPVGGTDTWVSPAGENQYQYWFNSDYVTHYSPRILTDPNAIPHPVGIVIAIGEEFVYDVVDAHSPLYITTSISRFQLDLPGFCQNLP